MTHIVALVRWCLASNTHLAVACAVAYVALSALYSVLPPKAAASPAGRLLGRLVMLTHSLAEGTLKLPGAAAPTVPQVVALAATPEPAPTGERPTVTPPPAADVRAP